jgi:catechol 2,3-dioxygenase-like lactoylglutathione lyase family enzyme
MIPSKLPTFIGQRFDQIAFVVTDLEESQRFFREAFGIDGWSVWNDQAKGQVDKTYRGEPEDFQFSCAYGFSGDVLVELCRHDSGRTVYKEWLDTKGPGLNHIGFRVADDAEFAEAEAVLTKQGAECAMGALRVGAGRYAYFDTVEQIGCFTEIYWVADKVLEVFERMKRGEILQRPD